MTAKLKAAGSKHALILDKAQGVPPTPRLMKILDKTSMVSQHANVGRVHLLDRDTHKEIIMLDIGKFARDEHLAAADIEGNMYGLDAWSPHKAQVCAKKEGIFLTEEHWSVIYSVRELYREHGDTLNAREVSRYLDREFSDDGGRRHLYELFPGGPVSQASRIAGIPLPVHSADPSFGSVW
jgi:tRNA 2-thiouridine synthesizing protein E